MKHAWIALLLVPVALAGCLQDEPPAPTPGTDTEGTQEDAGAYAVVAVLDTAVNPYHVHYQRNESLPDAILQRFVDPTTGEAPIRVSLATEGTLEERRNADRGFWDNIRSGQVYYFEGTRLLAVAHGGNIIDGGSHGTGTTAAVFDANPDAIVVLSQGFGAASEQWSGQQPWIDFLSESYGPIGSPPAWLVAGSSTAEANRVKWNMGGIPIGASDNTPAAAPVDSTAGPPWVVGVAGDHPEGEGQCREPISGTAPDFTADFTQMLPVSESIDEYRSMSGTSFATPTTAGSYSLALQMVRDAWGHEGGIADGALAVGPEGQRLTNVDLRDAFNRTAYYFDFSAICNEPGSVPVNPEAPWTQQGWGHIDATVGEAAAHHILGVAEAPPKPDEAVQFMETIYAERRATWGDP